MSQPKPTRFSPPPLEWKGHSYKWKLSAQRYPLPRDIAYLLFSQGRDESWWFKVGFWQRLGFRDITSVTPWRPVPGFDFELPTAAVLMRETAILPSMTPSEWAAERRRLRAEEKKWEEVA